MVDPRRRSYEIRPRLVWGGLAGVCLGMALVALGVAVSSWTWSVAGVLLLAAGVAVGVAGGGLHDTRRPGLLSEEADAVVRGDARQVVRHGRLSGPPARAAREADEIRRVLLASTARTSARPLAPLAALVLGATGLLLLAAQSPLYPMSHTGQLGSLRALGAGIVFTLSGLRVLVAANARHPLAAGLAAATALGLIAGALFVDHQSASAPVVEALAGVVGLVTSVGCMVGAERPPDDQG